MITRKFSKFQSNACFVICTTTGDKQAQLHGSVVGGDARSAGVQSQLREEHGHKHALVLDRNNCPIRLCILLKGGLKGGVILSSEVQSVLKFFISILPNMRPFFPDQCLWLFH